MPKAPAAHAPPCVQCLSARGLRCLQRFHAKHGQQAAKIFEEAGSRFLGTMLRRMTRLGQRGVLRICDHFKTAPFVANPLMGQVQEPRKRRAPVSTVPEERREGLTAAV